VVESTGQTVSLLESASPRSGEDSQEVSDGPLWCDVPETAKASATAAVVTGSGNGGLSGAEAMVRSCAVWKPPSGAAMVIVDGAVAKGDGRDKLGLSV
jgi:hypothetical protein